jgi:hypothetical protein
MQPCGHRTPSYNVALIELAEGPRVMSRVEGIAPDAVRIGMKLSRRGSAAPTMSPARSCSSIPPNEPRRSTPMRDRLSARPHGHRRRRHPYGIGEAPGYALDGPGVRMPACWHWSEAGLKPADVDALFICLPDDVSLRPAFWPSTWASSPKLTDNNRTGGSAFLTHVLMGRAGAGQPASATSR